MFVTRLLPLGAVLLVALLAVLGTARVTSGAAPEMQVGDPVRGGVVGETYRVGSGDTLWQIAVDRYGGDPREAVWKIRERNGLEDPLIRPGQVLVLP